MSRMKSPQTRKNKHVKWFFLCLEVPREFSRNEAQHSEVDQMFPLREIGRINETKSFSNVIILIWKKQLSLMTKIFLLLPFEWRNGINQIDIYDCPLSWKQILLTMQDKKLHKKSAKTRHLSIAALVSFRWFFQ